MTQIATFPSPTLPRSKAAFALSTLAALFWGTNFEATRIVLEGMDPWTAAATRFVIATAAIMLRLGMSGGFDVASLRRNLIAFCVLGIIGVAGFNAALFLGMRSSSPVTAALIMATSPLTTTLLDALLQGRRPSTRTIAGHGHCIVRGGHDRGGLCRDAHPPGRSFDPSSRPGLGDLYHRLPALGARGRRAANRVLDDAQRDRRPGDLALWLGDPLDGIAHAGDGSGRRSCGWRCSDRHWPISSGRSAYRSAAGAGPTSVLFNLVPVAALILAAILGRMPQPMQVAGVAIAILGWFWASGCSAARGRAGRFRHGFGGRGRPGSGRSAPQ
ncbi:MAG: DMT family transporter [Paracoccus sp. (in: a-proteobacteria)]